MSFEGKSEKIWYNGRFVDWDDCKIHIASHVMLTGGKIDAFIEAVYNYPTLSDSYQYAAYDGLDKWLAMQK